MNNDNIILPEHIPKIMPMARSSMHNCTMPYYEVGKCGFVGVWDRESEMGYRCNRCLAMFGSIASCKESRV